MVSVLQVNCYMTKTASNNKVDLLIVVKDLVNTSDPVVDDEASVKLIKTASDSIVEEDLPPEVTIPTHVNNQIKGSKV